MNEIIIFTDGASRGNPGPGGWGAVLVVSSDGSRKVMELGGGEKNTTNNRMELQAAIGALDFVETPAVGAGTEAKIKIYTDSSYVLKGATSWVSLWEKKGWQTSAKKDVLNKDLWVKLSKLITGENKSSKHLEWHLISGHVGVPGNERCDEIATTFADGKTPELFFGPLSEYKINILEISANTEDTQKRSSAKARSKAAAYSYISKVGGIVQIHKTWAECEKKVKGARGALYKKALSPSEEKEIIADFEKR